MTVLSLSIGLFVNQFIEARNLKIENITGLYSIDLYEDLVGKDKDMFENKANKSISYFVGGIIGGIKGNYHPSSSWKNVSNDEINLIFGIACIKEDLGTCAKNIKYKIPKDETGKDVCLLVYYDGVRTC